MGQYMGGAEHVPGASIPSLGKTSSSTSKCLPIPKLLNWESTLNSCKLHEVEENQIYLQVI